MQTSKQVTTVQYISANGFQSYLTYVLKLNPTVLELDFKVDNFFIQLSTGFEHIPFIHNNTRPHPLYKNIASIVEALPCFQRQVKGST